MNGNFITKVNNSNIFLINDKNIPYYLSVPENTANVNIAINIYDGINNDNVANVLSLVNRDNLSIISPVFNSNVLNDVKNSDQNMFVKVDKYLSYLINSVYNILKANNKTVETKIVLINYNIYNDFNIWFKAKYKERVNSVDIENNDNNNEFQPMDITNIFKKEDLEIPVVDTQGENKASNVLDETQNIVTDNGETPKVETKDMGFISYVLLGVVVAVTSLLLLYLLI